MASKALLLTHIGQLVTPRGTEAARGSALQDLQIVEDAAVLCIAGKIVSVGSTDDALKDPWVKRHTRGLREVDCTDRVVIPGLVDSHTHPVFAAPRLVDFEKRLAVRATYHVSHGRLGVPDLPLDGQPHVHVLEQRQLLAALQVGLH